MLRTAAGAACGLLITYAVAVLTPLGQHLDTSIMVLIADAASDRRGAQLLLDHESAATMVALTAILTGLVALVRGVRPAFAVALTAVGTVISAEALKAMLTRPARCPTPPRTACPAGTSPQSPVWPSRQSWPSPAAFASSSRPLASSPSASLGWPR